MRRSTSTFGRGKGTSLEKILAKHNVLDHRVGCRHGLVGQIRLISLSRHGHPRRRHYSLSQSCTEVYASAPQFCAHFAGDFSKSLKVDRAMHKLPLACCARGEDARGRGRRGKRFYSHGGSRCNAGSTFNASTGGGEAFISLSGR